MVDVSEQPPIPLLWAKLQPPKVAETVIRRGALDTLLDADATLTAIVAPPGYGKTTVAAQLTDRMPGATAWVGLESADDEPVRFWTYVAAAFSTAGVAGIGAVYDLLSDGPTAVAAATLHLRALVEQAEKPLCLVLDDLHVIGDSEIHDTLTDWLRNDITGLRIVAVSRHDLELPVGRLRSERRLSEARTRELAFDAEETAELLASVFDLSELTDAQVRAVSQRTEGWPVGCTLAGLALRGHPDVDTELARFTGDTRHLAEYLATEALEDLDDDVRAFLLATSIVSTLIPDLCDAVTGEIGSLRVLRNLVASSVFTSALDDAATVFRYHPLFAEHLRSILLEEHPDMVGDLHRRASQWYANRGDADSAINHAIVAGDADRARELVMENSVTFSNAGHFGTIRSWAEGLERMDGVSTEVGLLMAWAMLNQRRAVEVDRWIEVARAAATLPIEAAALDVHVPTIRAHQARHAGDIQSMLTEASRGTAAAAALPVDQSSAIFLRADAGHGAASSVLGAAQFWRGDHEAARDSLDQAAGIAIDNGMTLEVGFCYQYLAVVAAEAGELVDAEAFADQALVLSGPEGERHHQPILAHVALAIVGRLTGRPADADAALGHARRLAAIRPEPLAEALISLESARLHHQLGRQDEARRALREAKHRIDGLATTDLGGRIRRVENEIRFVARDATELPIGARELTDRELGVLTLLPHGLTRRELAAQLHVSENTVKTHLTSIRHKLGVRGRESIVARAEELGLL